MLHYVQQQVSNHVCCVQWLFRAFIVLNLLLWLKTTSASESAYLSNYFLIIIYTYVCKIYCETTSDWKGYFMPCISVTSDFKCLTKKEIKTYRANSLNCMICHVVRCLFYLWVLVSWLWAVLPRLRECRRWTWTGTWPEPRAPPRARTPSPG